MFGLSPMELLLLVGVVALVGGPAAVMKAGRLVRSAHQAKSQLTTKAIMGKILEAEPDEDAPPRKRKNRS